MIQYLVYTVYAHHRDHCYPKLWFCNNPENWLHILLLAICHSFVAILVECESSKRNYFSYQNRESERSQLQGHLLLVSDTQFVHLVMLNYALNGEMLVGRVMNIKLKTNSIFFRIRTAWTVTDECYFCISLQFDHNSESNSRAALTVLVVRGSLYMGGAKGTSTEKMGLNGGYAAMLHRCYNCYYYPR